MKKLFQYLASASLLIAAHNVSAQYVFNTYSGTLSIKKSLSDQCSLLSQGDQASINIFLSANGDGGVLFKQKVDLGNFGFVTTTASGVPVQGTGDLVANYRGGTFTITQMTVGDPAGEHCDLSGLSIQIKVSALSVGLTAAVNADTTVDTTSTSIGDGWFIWPYVGTLSFPSAIITGCPLLQSGDEASIYWYSFFGDALSKGKYEVGEITFYTTATSGAPVTGTGTLVLNSNTGALNVTALTIGDPAAEHCTFENLNIKVQMKLNQPHGHRIAF